MPSTDLARSQVWDESKRGSVRGSVQNDRRKDGGRDKSNGMNEARPGNGEKGPSGDEKIEPTRVRTKKERKGKSNNTAFKRPLASHRQRMGR